MKLFQLSDYYKSLLKFIIGISAILAVLINLWPLLPEERIGDPEDAFWSSVGLTMVLIIAFIYGVVGYRRIYRFDIELDEQGLWHKYLGREKGFISWGNIAQVKERNIKQCLDVIDASGKRRARISYYLSGYDILRSEIVDRISAQSTKAVRASFKKGIGYHLFMILGVAAILGVIYYWFQMNGQFLLVVVASVFILGVGLYEYLTTASEVQIKNDALDIKFSFLRKVIFYHEIKAVHLGDELDKGQRLPAVWVHLNTSSKPIKLQKLGVDANVLYKAVLDGMSK